MATRDTERQETSELLPWYLNGTLDDAEANRLRRELEHDPAMQAEADTMDALLKEVAEEVPVPMLTHERIERMMARVDAEPRRAGRLTLALEGVRRWWNSLAVDYRIPAAVAATLALVAFLVMSPQPTPDNGEFRTLSDDRPPVSVQVEVDRSLSEAEAQALFAERSLNAERQAGGIYVITLSGDTSVSELYEMLQTLRADGRVVDARALTDED